MADEEPPSAAEHGGEEEAAAPERAPRVEPLRTIEDWNECLERAGGDRLVVALFGAAWSEPCQRVMPTFLKYAADPAFDFATFALVDADDKQLFALRDIKAVPCYQVMWLGKTVTSCERTTHLPSRSAPPHCPRPARPPPTPPPRPSLWHRRDQAPLRDPTRARRNHQPIAATSAEVREPAARRSPAQTHAAHIGLISCPRRPIRWPHGIYQGAVQQMLGACETCRAAPRRAPSLMRRTPATRPAIALGLCAPRPSASLVARSGGRSTTACHRRELIARRGMAVCSLTNIRLYVVLLT